MITIRKFITTLFFILTISAFGQQNDSLKHVIDSVYKNNPIYINDYYKKEYYPNGNIKWEGHIIRMRYDDEGDMLAPVGKTRLYHKNGTINEIETYDINGFQVDTTKVYDKSGNLTAKIAWDSLPGSLRKKLVSIRSAKGYSIFSYNNGLLSSIYKYKAVDGMLLKEGDCILYNADGAIKKVMTFKDGKKVSQ